jgi:hypothetical protein
MKVRRSDTITAREMLPNVVLNHVLVARLSPLAGPVAAGWFDVGAVRLILAVQHLLFVQQVYMPLCGRGLRAPQLRPSLIQVACEVFLQFVSAVRPVGPAAQAASVTDDAAGLSFAGGLRCDVLVRAPYAPLQIHVLDAQPGAARARLYDASESAGDSITRRSPPWRFPASTCIPWT